MGMTSRAMWRIYDMLLAATLEFTLPLSDCLSHRHTITYSLCRRLHDVKSRAESLRSLTNHKQLIEHGAYGNAAPFGPEEWLSLWKSGYVNSGCQPVPLPSLHPLLPSCLCFFLSITLWHFSLQCLVNPFLPLPDLTLIVCCNVAVSLYTAFPSCSDFTLQSDFNFI